ncbi:hypothetical protein PTSG_10078 [Salpingoeca rosetta]|uniref:Ion transport domain-containing protein n=1 Tax=Salpingoeca rosetta (strain ATCC 50818 / BSB-021) TaxID=946362 RepID=F2UPF2_SALR5|nr:uncharacterized protein PTSG_10078 [Salpingoeca rosetta]EGD79507.1 hypothetical protein PTSG_10078 [Salpingoeca rosetta]|eukprot:XP_004988988.1 hypothetical protein PTSG_10078 [Salpingoeca rosetta]
MAFLQRCASLTHQCYLPNEGAEEAERARRRMDDAADDVHTTGDNAVQPYTANDSDIVTEDAFEEEALDQVPEMSMPGAVSDKQDEQQSLKSSRGSRERFFRNEIEMSDLNANMQDEMARVQKGQELVQAASDQDLGHVTALLSELADANFRDVFGKTPLLCAARRGNLAITEVLLKEGANPNIGDVRGVDPLYEALTRKHVDVAKALLRAGADPVHTLTALTNILEGVKDYAIELLVQDEMLCCAPEVLRVCFRLSYHLNMLSQRQEERKHFYSGLRDRCRDLAVNLLAACNDMWDVRRLLAEGTGLLGLALKYDQTLFVSHPYCQEYMKELWLGQYVGVYGKEFFGVVLKYIFFPLVFPYYLILFALQTPKNLQFSRLGDYVRLCHTPFVKFMGHMTSFILFLVLLIVASTEDSHVVPNGVELALGAWVIALIIQEAREIYQTPSRIYLASVWNWLDITNQLLYLAVIVMRVVLYADRNSRDDSDDLLFASNVTLALAALLSCIRFLNVLEVHHLLGPLQISIRQIISDLVVFLAILLVFMLAFAVALTKVFEHLEDIPANEMPLAAFGSFEASLRTTFWGIFALIELGTFTTIEGVRGTEVRVIGEVLFGAYMVVVFILLINLLIAIITNTYQRIVDNSDVVWCFARARLIREFQSYPAVPAPLNLILEPLEVVVRMSGISVHSVVQVNTGHSSTDQAEEEEQLRKLANNLVERHLRHATSVDDADDISVSRSLRDGGGDDSADMRAMMKTMLDKMSALEQKIAALTDE